jgi:hypothetical protein
MHNLFYMIFNAYDPAHTAVHCMPYFTNTPRCFSAAYFTSAR